ncbi:ABC transporter permease EcsB [Staphylococcus kloosii]|jgi:ABC-2 type transport system permease protein|uniref:Multidrug ABC transporter ATP-binding protein n=1 Tax=Staphylococcus kloosii TaxID=29384 RepID=A0ABQ0XMF8_9STAP|nr:ABC transporter permease [Staphylococcus kloosii]AVQ35845.1 multidrug ABC transporter ATP-binding protein [Staphylococcus kloosii]PNZ05536.1 multidrug ABC transporter ATP-binding protein [Staphylococcus kloosii]PTJ73884.1 multidrug ABC transporter ATP-binding protein [Staphylococcus kloosii]SUM48915.1 transporter protein [Staphylococcus kloosii]GEP82613.1 multidrug ABC transporter ATP-binding protein [Staphylococcus kloosii]
MNQSAQALFKSRKLEIAKEKQYYNKFVFNGHFGIFLLILLGAFILGYGQFLKSIPTNLNFPLIVGVILALTSLFPIRTLLKDADRLFLLPFEKHMTEYMKRSLKYSYFLRLPIQILMVIIFFPLFYVLNHQTYMFYIMFAILTLVYPFIGLILKWEWYKYKLESWSIHLLLFIIFLTGYYLVLEVKSFTAITTIIILIALIYIIRYCNKKELYPWEKMIASEAQHRMNYYKFVNMFTDVKHLKETAVRRSYLDPLLRIPKHKHFNENYMYLFLFYRSFMRGKDAFNIIIRLIVIALILMIWLNQMFISAIIGALFMYIIILQMAQFYTQQAYGLWPQVWPVPDSKVIKGYEQFLYRLMLVLGIIFSIVYIIIQPTQFYFAILFFIVGWLTINSVIKKLKYQETLLRD